MRFKLHFIFICVLILVSVAYAEPVHVVDSMGRNIDLDAPAEEIGVVNLNVAEAIRVIGAWDKVIATDGGLPGTGLESYYPNLDKLQSLNAPNISSPDQKFVLDYEKIMEMKPDLIIVSYQSNVPMTMYQDMIDNLEPEVPVMFIELGIPDTYANSLMKLGEVTGNTEGAQKYIDFYNGIIDSIKAKTSTLTDEEKPDVFIKLAGYTPDQLYTNGAKSDSWNQIFSIVGADSITADVDAGWVELDPEWILGKKIDAIIMQCWSKFYPESFGYTATNPTEKTKAAEQIISDIDGMEIFSKTKAVRDGNVFLIDSQLTGTPRFIIGIAYYAKWLHPELFEDLDPEQLHYEYLKNFIGADIDLDKVGLFAYPEV
ncbi:ABC transporter substrate-binding protein [Methanospirillum stamsii]|nr:ABC transporter substrate-binding protein [Methanospirillum stamsii]